MSRIKILLVDDHLVVRMGIAAMLSYEKDIQVVGEAESGEEALTVADAVRPDVVLMDLMLSGLNGAETTERLLKAHPDTKVLILTTFLNSPEMTRARVAGAMGAMDKGSSKDELLAAIHSVAAGHAAFAEDLSRGMMDVQETSVMSERQLEVLSLVAKGFSNRDIARILGIGPESVKSHLKRIFTALDVSTRAEAVSVAINRGLMKDQT